MTDNELIAEFMGAVKSQDYGVCGWMGYWINQGDPSATDVREMRYHQSWDWLMPVVEKINTLRHFGNIDATDRKRMYGVSIFDTQTTVYKAVVEFIKWYNTQKA